MNTSYFAQGFDMARDRLFHIDLWRKKGLGLLAEDFGAGYLAQDYASRLFLSQGDIWAVYGEEARKQCENFTAGINAYIDQAFDLSSEFTELNFKPSKWRAEDCLSIRLHAFPPSHRLHQGDAPLAALDLYKCAMADVTFTTARLSAKLEDAWNWVKMTGDTIESSDTMEEPFLHIYENAFDYSENEERFKVRGSLTQVIPAKYTKQGPVLFEDFVTGRSYVLGIAALRAPHLAAVISALATSRQASGIS